MKAAELVSIKTIAQRTGYSLKYLQNRWSFVLAGIRPKKLVDNGKLLFDWNQIEQKLNQGGLSVNHAAGKAEVQFSAEQVGS